MTELRRRQARQAENERQFGDSCVAVYREGDGHIVWQAKPLPPPVAAERVALICTRNNGSPVRHGVLAELLRKAGLNAHSFRHTHTTVLAENGVPAKAIAGRLGHTNTQITQNLYTHNTLKMQEEAAAVFAKTLQETP